MALGYDAELMREGREGVTCVVLGRGASTEKVEQWLEAAATVEGCVYEGAQVH